MADTKLTTRSHDIIHVGPNHVHPTDSALPTIIDDLVRRNQLFHMPRTAQIPRRPSDLELRPLFLPRMPTTVPLKEL